MKRTMLTTALLTAATAAAASPQIGAILNAASYTRPGLPNYGIAPGSMFVVLWDRIGTCRITAGAGLPVFGDPRRHVYACDRRRDDRRRDYGLHIRDSGGRDLAVQHAGRRRLLAVTYQGRTGESGAFRILRSAPGLLTLTETGSWAGLGSELQFRRRPTAKRADALCPSGPDGDAVGHRLGGDGGQRLDRACPAGSECRREGVRWRHPGDRHLQGPLRLLRGRGSNRHPDSSRRGRLLRPGVCPDRETCSATSRAFRSPPPATSAPT